MHVHGLTALAILAIVPALALADATTVRHPVYPCPYDQSNKATLESWVADLAGLSDAELAALVPTVNGFLFCGCPNCSGGTQEGQIAWNGPKDPDRVHCRFCNMVFPNERFPENQTETAINFRGEKVTYHFYQDAKGGKHYFTGRACYERKHWMADRAYYYACLYALTKDTDRPAAEEYAHRAAVILDRYGEAYPGWCVHKDLCFGPKGPVSEAKPPYPYWGGIWDRWFYCDIPNPLVLAYDLVYDSGAFEKLPARPGADPKARLEREVFRPAVAFVRTYPEYLSNMSPCFYEGFVTTGRVLGEPDFVHDAIDRLKQLMRTQFLFDGMWKEGSISYHAQTLGGLQNVISRVKGYSDPPEYEWRDGSHFADLDLVRDFPFLRKATDAPKVLCYPNGRIVPVHDAWASETRGKPKAQEPALLSDMGHAALGFGFGNEAIAAHLHFSGGYGHEHADNLSITLWARGRELLSDIGYTHTAWRSFATSTPAHNTVAVDEADQHSSGHGGDTVMFVPKLGPLQVVEGDASGCAYPKVTSVYRRLIAVVPVNERDGYVVDVFRVAGGRQHDYFLHGDDDTPAQVEANLPLQPIPGALIGEGVKYRLPSTGETDYGEAPEGKNVAYGFIDRLRGAPSDGDCTVTFTEAEAAAPRLRTTLIGQPGTQIVLAEAPSIRGAKDDDAKLRDYKTGAFVARRSGTGLQSVFIAVHRPIGATDFVKQVRCLSSPRTATDPVVLSVTTAAGEDIFVIRTDPAAGGLTPGSPVVCDGRFGWVRSVEGKVIAAGLVGGTQLKCGAFALSSKPPITGKLLSVERKEGSEEAFAFTVAEMLPAGKVLAGQWMVVKHADGSAHAYEIASVEASATGSVIRLTGDPGFGIAADGTTRFLYHPVHELKGDNMYRIDNVASFAVGGFGGRGT